MDRYSILSASCVDDLSEKISSEILRDRFPIGNVFNAPNNSKIYIYTSNEVPSKSIIKDVSFITLASPTVHVRIINKLCSEGWDIYGIPFLCKGKSHQMMVKYDR